MEDAASRFLMGRTFSVVFMTICFVHDYLIHFEFSNKCRIVCLHAQTKDSLTRVAIPIAKDSVLAPSLFIQIPGVFALNMSNPYAISPTRVVQFANDSLYVPDSLMEKHDKVFWTSDTDGTWPYGRILPNGLHIGWPEQYTNGGFRFRIYKNYLIAMIGHENPNPNMLLYVQSITASQYAQIYRLMMSGKDSSAILIYDQVDRLGNRYVNWGLNHRALGLYDELMYNDSTGELYPDALEKAEAQFYKGLTAIIKTFNQYLTEKIAEPGVVYKHCYSHYIWHEYFNGVYALPAKK